MTVKRIDTLGCHPLLLMKKLAAIGGLEILTEEKFTYNEVDYPHRTIAKVKDGIYMEAEDLIFKEVISAETIPKRHIFISEHITSLFSKFEATEADKYARIESPSGSLPSLVDIEDLPAISSEDVSVSMLVTLPLCEAACSVNSPTGFSMNSKAVDTSFIAITGELEEEVEFANGWGNSYFLQGTPREGGLSYPFGIVTAAKGALSFPLAIKSKVYTNSGSYAASDILLLSGSRIRVAKELTEAGELLNPSDWTELPIFTSILNSDEGLVFFTASSTGNILVVSTVDTSKGNGFGENPPVMYRKTPFAINSTGRVTEACHVIGSSGNPTATKSMCAYRPAPPVANDSISGGPVVTDIFAYDLEEIRGTIPGVLSCSENLPVGTIGWLEGKRYRVTLPGTMLQIG